MMVAEQDDEWQDGRCWFRPETVVLTDTRAVEVVLTLLRASQRLGDSRASCCTTHWDMVESDGGS
jgi:hypothetical protein